MNGRAYYNEIDPDAVRILQALIAEGVIAPGDVDSRSIKDVHPNDLRGYSQVHLFAGGGIWSVAARLAGWPDDRPLWTASCPCQPFSVAGKGGGRDDPRHLWPDCFRLIYARRPAVIMGEQVAGAAGRAWFDGVSADLERDRYACRAVDIPACAVDAPHIRQRLYWLADADDAERRSAQPGRHIDHGAQARRHEGNCHAAERRNGSFWSDHEWRTGADGKARRVKPGLRLLVDGIHGRVGLLRIGGNAIVAQLAKEVIAAYMDVTVWNP